jgi:hypothetical protein
MGDRPDDPKSNEIEQARARFEMLQSRLNAAKIAYLNRSPLDGKDVTYVDLNRIAKDVIEANYELQRRRYGEVRVKLSPAKLLRRGR